MLSIHQKTSVSRLCAALTIAFLIFFNVSGHAAEMRVDRIRTADGWVLQLGDRNGALEFTARNRANMKLKQTKSTLFAKWSNDWGTEQLEIVILEQGRKGPDVMLYFSGAGLPSYCTGDVSRAGQKVALMVGQCLDGTLWYARAASPAQKPNALDARIPHIPRNGEKADVDSVPLPTGTNLKSILNWLTRLDVRTHATFSTVWGDGDMRNLRERERAACDDDPYCLHAYRQTILALLVEELSKR